MKIFPCLFSALTAAAVSLVLCSAATAAPLQILNLTIENHQKLVTVKDDSGKWLFAQVITTPNLEISEVSLGEYLTRLTLRDASGKPLWTRNFDAPLLGICPRGEWSDKFVAGLFQATNSLGWKYNASDTSPDSNPNRFEFIIGADDHLVTMHTSTKKHYFEITPIKNGFMAKADDNKTLIILQPPAPVVAQTAAPSASAESN